MSLTDHHQIEAGLIEAFENDAVFMSNFHDHHRDWSDNAIPVEDQLAVHIDSRMPTEEDMISMAHLVNYLDNRNQQ